MPLLTHGLRALQAVWDSGYPQSYFEFTKIYAVVLVGLVFFEVFFRSTPFVEEAEDPDKGWLGIVGCEGEDYQASGCLRQYDMRAITRGAVRRCRRWAGFGEGVQAEPGPARALRFVEGDRLLVAVGASGVFYASELSGDEDWDVIATWPPVLETVEDVVVAADIAALPCANLANGGAYLWALSHQNPKTGKVGHKMGMLQATSNCDAL